MRIVQCLSGLEIDGMAEARAACGGEEQGIQGAEFTHSDLPQVRALDAGAEFGHTHRAGGWLSWNAEYNGSGVSVLALSR